MDDYEHVRNMTLMFFLDRLMDKGQPRTLHDLSCQFGTKGFTKEMRQIAGGGQSGLRKFLSQFPSLFTIEGDSVFITQTVANSDAADLKRDYSKEAVEFFVKRMEQYGNAEVPIKSLLGHRSQAAPEIRHVSGQHARDFREFLLKHAEVFVVRDEYVVLKSVLDHVKNNQSSNGLLSLLTRLPEETPLDPYLSQQFINLIEDEVVRLNEDADKKGKVSVETLFNHIKNNFEADLWSKMVKNANDLNTFLKMNSKIFHCQSNIVSLTPERDQQRSQQQAQQQQLQQQQVQQQYLSPSHKSHAVHTNNNNNSNVSSNGSSTASTPVSSPCHSSSRVNSAGSSGSFHQRLRSHLMKAVTDNSKMKQLKGAANQSNNSSNNISACDVKLMRNTKIITRIKEGEEIVRAMISGYKAVALDCEGVNLGTNGKITLVQLAPMPLTLPNTNDTVVYLFDVLVNPQLLSGCLKELFESEKIAKIINDARNDSSALYLNHSITLANIFDTQVAHAVIQQQNTGRPAYKAKYVSLETLCESYGGPTPSFRKEQIKKYYRRDNQYWAHRPLTDEMICYAAFDVFALVPDVYHNMTTAIRTEYYPLLNQLHYESIFAKIKPDEIKKVKKQRKNEMEVTDLKHKLYNNEVKQVVLSNREIRLLRYIDLTDEIRAKIDGYQKVAKKLDKMQSRKNSGDPNNLIDLSSEDGEGESDGDSNEHTECGEEYSFETTHNNTNTSPEMVINVNGNGNSSGLFSPSESIISNEGTCCCSCHNNLVSQNSTNNSDEIGANSTSPIKTSYASPSPTSCDASTQTLSTGDIVITKVYFPENNE